MGRDDKVLHSILWHSMLQCILGEERIEQYFLVFDIDLLTDLTPFLGQSIKLMNIYPSLCLSLDSCLI